MSARRFPRRKELYVLPEIFPGSPYLPIVIIQLHDRVQKDILESREIQIFGSILMNE